MDNRSSCYFHLLITKQHQHFGISAFFHGSITNFAGYFTTVGVFCCYSLIFDVCIALGDSYLVILVERQDSSLKSFRDDPQRSVLSNSSYLDAKFLQQALLLAIKENA